MIGRKIDYALISLIIFLVGSCAPQKMKFKLSDLRAPNTISAAREKFKQQLIENTILKNLSLELSKETESAWEDALWGMELALYRSDSVLNSLKRAFKNIYAQSEPFQRAFLETVYCLYPNEFGEEVFQFAHTTNSPKLFAMAIHYLQRIQPNKNPEFQAWLAEQFPNWGENPILFMLQENLNLNRPNRPPLIDILKHPFERGKTIIYSFQRNDRNYSGLTIIKKPDGKFVRTQDNNIFHIRHLARSFSNLPGYITNGSTPQGIFSIQGIDVSRHTFIGQTPNLQLVMPYEGSVRKFFHNDQIIDTTWTKDSYQQLLPENWKSYVPIYEAYYAGRAGRTEIIAHGTTINPEFYNGRPYYPNTPSLGCLTAKEIWSGSNGHCLISDQLVFINAYRSTGCPNGYFVVIELDDKNQPVVLDEILMDVLRAENSLKD